MPSLKPHCVFPETAHKMSRTTTIDTAVGICQLRRSERKTLAISVLPDGSVELVAPEDASLSDVAAKVKRRSQWVRKQRWAFSNMNSERPPLKYHSGATHRYLGRQYRLKINKGGEACVKLKGPFFHIISPENSPEEVQRLMSQWLRQHAKEQFSKRLARWEPWCTHRKLHLPKLHLRTMPKRWGSAHTDGRIFLNPDLIRTPSVCIDYVIAHEVCHLQYPSHDKAFYQLLSEVFPNRKAVKLRLEQAEF